MSRANSFVGTVKLIDRKTRVVELLGPELPGSRRPTDRKLLFERRQASLVEYMAGPQSVGSAFKRTDDRRGSSLDDGLGATPCLTSWLRDLGLRHVPRSRTVLVAGSWRNSDGAEKTIQGVPRVLPVIG